LKDCVEAFCCGTGASLTPVGEVVEVINDNTEVRYNCWRGERKAGAFTKGIYDILQGIMWGDDKEMEEKYKEWIAVVKP